VATVPEIHVVHVPVRDADDLVADAMSAVHSWAPVEVPRGRHPTPIVLAVLGTLAGIGAMALGAIAVLSAGGSSEGTTSAPAAAARQVTATSPGVGERALALLAKPSTERIAFQGSGGRLVLAVGTGGRAAILLRGFERAVDGKPYYAWIVAPGRAPVRAGRFVGTEPALFLTRPLGPSASVVVSADRPVPGRPGRPQVVATRR
jgi:Anti-sigma-K factor rskA, C-terminal